MACVSLPIQCFTGAALALALSLAQAQVHSSRGEHLLKELTAKEATLAAARSQSAALPNTPAADRQRFGLLSGPLQLVGNARMFVGDAHGALDALDESIALGPAKTPPTPEALARIAATSPVDAISAIVGEARQRQVVILNESHHVPMHRAFAMQLARELRKLGYTHLAAETFYPKMMSQGYVGYGSGYYTQDPVFANFVRDAAKDGWKFVGYEHEPADIEADNQLPPDEQRRQRESGQARNLVERILAQEPQAKIFIFVGYGHARKTTTGSVRMMADYFKEMSKIDPLSIDQTLMFAHVRAEAEHPLYPALASKGGGKSVVLRGANGAYQVFASPPGAYDMQVIHPALPIDPATGRAAWLSQLGGASPHAVPQQLMPTSGRRVVLAMRPKAAIDEVPLDVVLLEAGKKAPMLMLPSGPFELKTVD